MYISERELDDGCSRINYRKAEIRWLEMFVYEENGIVDTATYRGILVDDPAPIDGRFHIGTIQDWIYRQGTFDRSRQFAGKEIKGGLRLLCFNFNGTPMTLPFHGSELKDMIRQLDLPRSYAERTKASRSNNYAEYIVDIQQNALSSGRPGINITCIAPYFVNEYMEIGLSYDANTKITSGLLGLYDLVASGRLNRLEADLVSLPEMCAHPMLLPLLACNTWHHTMINTFDRTYAKIRRVQQETGMMKGYFDRAPDELRGRAMHGEYEDMHARIVEAHEYSSNVLWYFMNDFSSALQGAFDGPLKILPCEKSASDEARVYSKSLIHRVRVQLNRREQLLASINLQVQVLYNLMQQRDSRINLEIGRESRRDSSAMKTLSLITAIFLPLTAVASIFSMDLFFVDSNSHITLSKQFWIYWAAVLPLTVVVLGAWIFWINRKQVFAWWRGRKEYDEEDSLNLKYE